MKLILPHVTAESAFHSFNRVPKHMRTAGWVLASLVLLLAGCGGSESSGRSESEGGDTGNPTLSLCERSLCDADYDKCVSRDEYANCIGDCECYTLDFIYRRQCELLCDDKCSSREPDEAECLSQRAACRRTARDSMCESMGVGGGSGLGTSGAGATAATGGDAGTGGTGATGGATATGGTGNATGGAAATGGADDASAGGSGGTAASSSGGSEAAGAGATSTWPDTHDEVLRVCDFSLECMHGDYGYVFDSEIRREGGVCVLFVPSVTTPLLADGKTGQEPYSEWHITDAGLNVCREDPSSWCTFQCRQGTPPAQRCTGTPTVCGDLPLNACTGVAACAVVDGACKGVTRTCPGYVDATKCTAAGCDWDEQ